MDWNLVRIEKYISNIDLMYAHTVKEEGNKKTEKLINHLILTIQKLKDFDISGGCIDKIRLLVKDILLDIRCFDSTDLNYMEDFLVRAILNAIFLHDIGKCNIAFQSEIMKNDFFKKNYIVGMNSNHSLYSAKIYLDFMLDEALAIITNRNNHLNQQKTNKKLWVTRYILVIFANCIVSHHSRIGSPKNLIINLLNNFGVNEYDKIVRLSNPSELANYTYSSDETVKLQSFINDTLKYKGVIDILKPSAEKMYVLTKLIYSALCLTDTLSTTSYMNDISVSPSKIDSEEAISKFKEDDIYKSIMRYRETGVVDTEINAIRSDMFIESENNLVNNIDKNVFYLEAPTGGGKTNMSTNIALKIIELTSNTEKPITRFLYTAPFNSITTQTADTLNKLLLNSFIDVTTVNCDNPIPIVDSDEEFKYQLSLIDYQMLNYPITLTSHIKLFQALFGVSRIDNHMLLNMLNSVVIIDEIQAYNPAVWGKMMKLIDVYSKYLNMKFVIMSATLPKIGNLLDNNTRYSEYIELINNAEKYFKKDCFRNRVDEYNYSLLDGLCKNIDSYNDKDEYRKLIFDALIDKIKEEFKSRDNCKIIVEFIKKQSAQSFYNKIKSIKNELCDKVTIREFTGDTSNYSREKTIKKAKVDGGNLIIVSTQCIEAGVDISMDVGFKDISFIDSEEQLAGRMNRNFNNDGVTKIYFFNLDNAASVYGKTINIFKGDMTLLDVNYRYYLQNKNYSDMFARMIGRTKELLYDSNVKTSIRAFDNKVQELNYKEIEKELELIEKRNEIMLFFPINIKIQEDNSFSIVNGNDVWKELCAAIKIEDFAEKKVKTKYIMTQAKYFCYKFTLPWRVVKGNSIEDIFKEKLGKKHISYSQLAGLFRINIDSESIKDFIDFEDDYRFDQNNLLAFLGIDMSNSENLLY